LTGRVALVTGAASGIGRTIATRLAAEGAAVVIADRDTAGAESVARSLGGHDTARAVTVDVTDEDAVTAAVRSTCAMYGGVDLVVNNAGLSVSKPLLETTAADWDRQHDVMARGSFLISQAAARAMAAQELTGDIVYVVSKNGVVAGPQNVAYGAAKADQAHQVRLLATELGPMGIRVNGVNPDGVVRGSGIFEGAWGEERAKVYGVLPEELGRFYAGRTLLQQEVLPEHVAAAVYALVAGDLSLTTGTIVPVDGGVPAAFLR
jgi:NAD(P)-dependent dehydrogenase (short-subunit alcohol dehydrogenase family)